MKEMSYITRWLFSTSHKDIGILYLMFGMISAMVATGMSVIIRMELSNGNSTFLFENNQIFNVIVTGHAIGMIFLFVMPVLIGAFGNFLVPILIGGVDMAFARLNNISFWCLPPALVCIIASVLIEQGAGTGWTVLMLLYLDKEFIEGIFKISFDAWISLSYIIYLIYLSYIIYRYFIKYSNMNIFYIKPHTMGFSYGGYIYKIIYSVKTFITIGQYACIYAVKQLYIHQRLNMIIYRNIRLSFSKIKDNNLPSINNSENKIKLDKYYKKDNNLNFEEWLVGFTDGDGTFNIFINKEETKVTFTYKISQNKYNQQLLYKIKKELKVGKIARHEKTMISYILRNKTHIEEVLFPIFDKYTLLSSKFFNYLKFKESILISNDPFLSQKDKILKIKSIKNKIMPENYVSPAWNKPRYAGIPVEGGHLKYTDINSVKDISHIISKSWLVGFIEAEGSFFLVKKSLSSKSIYGRYVHSFGISQKLDPIILYSIKYLFHIKASIKYKDTYYLLETSNSRSINNIINYFIKNNHKNLFKGMKSFEFNLWKRTFLNHKYDYDKLHKIQQIIRLLKKN